MTILNQHKKNRSLSSFFIITFSFFAVLFFAGLSNTGLFDVDEAIFAEASSEMLATGDYVTPSYNGEPRYHKPPLIYWLQSFSMQYLGVNEFSARLPSAIFGFLSVFGFYLFISGMTKNRRLALTVSIIFGANLSFFVISQAATADMALNFFVLMATLGFMANLFSERRSPFAPAVLGVVLGLAMLAKGPVSLMVPVFVIATAVFLRPNIIYSLKCVNPVYVFLALIITLVPWVQFVIEAKGVDFFKEFILVHNLGRFTNAMGNTQSGSPLYYVAVLMLGFFPWVLLLPSAIYSAVKNFLPALRSDKVIDALPSLGLVWFLSVILFFSFSATKLPHYILPAYAGAALMIAGRLETMYENPISKWNILWMAPVTFIFSSVFMLFKFLPDLLLGRIHNLPEIMQKTLIVLNNNYGVKISEANEQTRLALSQDVYMNSAPFIMGIFVLIAVFVGMFFIFKRKRAGVIVISVVSAFILLLVSYSVVPTIYKFTQLPLANIGEKIKNNFDKENDHLYFVAIHQPSVRFVSGVQFTALPTSAALIKQPVAHKTGSLWFVLKQERLKNLVEFVPKYGSNIDCEGGYCLVTSKVADIEEFLRNK